MSENPILKILEMMSAYNINASGNLTVSGILKSAIDRGDIEFFSKAAPFYIHLSNIDEYIDYAFKGKKVEITALLLEYKNRLNKEKNDML